VALRHRETIIMREVQFITGVSRTALDEQVLALLEDRIGADGVPRFLYLSPTLRKNRQMASLLREQRVSWRGGFYAPAELAEEIVKELPGQALQWITPEQKALIILRILEEAGAAGDGMEALAFRDTRTPMGVARHAARALDYLTRRGLSPRDPEAGLFASIGRALDLLSKRYQDALDTLGRADPVEIPIRAAQALEEGTGLVSERAELLVLDGFVAPEKIDADFMVALARRFADKEVVVTLPAGLAAVLKEQSWQDLSGDLRAFSHGEQFFTRLGWNGSTGLVPAAGGGSEPGARSTVRELHRYADRTEEVKGIARTIKRIFFADRPGNPLKPEDFHVVVPQIDSYYRLFIELFPRYGIPFNITRGIPLASIPVVSLIASLLEAVSLRDHEALFRFYSVDLVTVPQTDGGEEFGDFCTRHQALIERLMPVGAWLRADRQGLPHPDIWAVDRICREAGVRGGRDIEEDWIVPLTRYYSDLILEARASEDPDQEARVRDHFAAALWQVCFLDREFREFDRLAGTRPVEELVTGVEDLIDRYQVNANLLRSLMEVEREIPAGGRIILEKNVKGFDRALALLSEMADDLKLAGETITTAETFRELFLDRCRREMIHEAGELAGVSISQTLEIRNMARPVLFLAGLTAKDFPLTPTHNFLLPQGPDAESFRRAVDESGLIFSQAMENSERIILSYPAADGDEPMELSPFLEDLLHSGALVPAEDRTEQSGPLCRYEILQAAGRSWSEGTPLDWDRLAAILARTPVRSEESVKDFHHEVRRALTQVVLRSRPDAPGPYDGMVRDRTMLGAIGEMLDAPSFAYSTSMLNEYQDCGLAFFFKRILGLEPIREIPEEPEAVLIGSAVHQILATFYERWCAAGQGRVTPENRIEAIVSMHETAHEILYEHHSMGLDLIGSWAVRERIAKGLYGKEIRSDEHLLNRVQQGTDMPLDERGLLRLLADHEAEVNLPLYPWSMEYAFGFDDIPPLVVTSDRGGSIRIRGRIDRIDLYRPDLEVSAPAAWVFDYKTGRVPALKRVRQGLNLQLQVYLLAVMEGVCGLEVQDVGACFLELKKKQENPRKVIVFTNGIPDELRPAGKRSSWELTAADPEGIRQQIRDIDTGIRRGEFPRSRDPSQCHRCDFANACFRDEERVRLLSTERRNSAP
jgi:CRISPR/Cas system-associated exonuclease Cas4 (RecB family)